MKRGDLYWINFEPSSPPEFGKIRPAIVISNSEQNAELPTIVVIPLSSKPPEIWPLRVKISLPKRKKSYAVVPGIRHVNKTRLTRKIGSIDQKELDLLETAVQIYLSE